MVSGYPFFFHVGNLGACIFEEEKKYLVTLRKMK